MERLSCFLERRGHVDWLLQIYTDMTNRKCKIHSATNQQHPIFPVPVHVIYCILVQKRLLFVCYSWHVQCGYNLVYTEHNLGLNSATKSIYMTITLSPHNCQSTYMYLSYAEVLSVREWGLCWDYRIPTIGALGGCFFTQSHADHMIGLQDERSIDDWMNGEVGHCACERQELHVLLGR